MGDPKLVEKVLGEEWAQRAGELFVGDECSADFWWSGTCSLRVCHERARQAALGHRALRYLARMHEASENDTLHLKVDELSEEERSIIRELRGEP